MSPSCILLLQALNEGSNVLGSDFNCPGMLGDSSKKKDIADSNQGGGSVSLFVFALKLFRSLP